MLAFILWVFVGAIFFGAAKGIAEGGRLKGAPLFVNWAIVSALYVSLLVYFNPFAESDSKPKVSDYAKKQMALAMMACDSRVESRVNIPRTLDFKTLSTSRDFREGVATVRREFSAENAFGQTLDFTYLCSFQAGEVRSLEIVRD